MYKKRRNKLRMPGNTWRSPEDSQWNNAWWRGIIWSGWSFQGFCGFYPYPNPVCTFWIRGMCMWSGKSPEHDSVSRIASAQNSETEQTGQKQKRRKINFLFPGRWSCKNHYFHGARAYFRVTGKYLHVISLWRRVEYGLFIK